MVSITEIVLIVAGFVAVIVGFFIPAGKENGSDMLDITEREIRERVDDALDSYRSRLDQMVDDAAEEGISKAERALERLTNEKMDALGEYSDTVMNEVNRNHSEVVFLYEMLNDKQKSLKDTVSEVSKTADEARQTAIKAQETISMTMEEARVVRPQVTETVSSVRAASYEEDYNTARHSEDDREQAVISGENASGDGSDAETSEQNESGSFESISIGREILPEEREGVKIIESVQPDDQYYSQDTSGDDVSSDQAVRGSAGKIVPITEVSRRRNQESDPVLQNKKILEMHNAGKSNMVIARELGLGIGEVKLVIDLSEKQRRVAR